MLSSTSNQFAMQSSTPLTSLNYKSLFSQRSLKPEILSNGHLNQMYLNGFGIHDLNDSEILPTKSFGSPTNGAEQFPGQEHLSNGNRRKRGRPKKDSYIELLSETSKNIPTSKRIHLSNSFNNISENITNGDLYFKTPLDSINFTDSVINGSSIDAFNKNEHIQSSVIKCSNETLTPYSTLDSNSQVLINNSCEDPINADMYTTKTPIKRRPPKSIVRDSYKKSNKNKPKSKGTKGIGLHSKGSSKAKDKVHNSFQSSTSRGDIFHIERSQNNHMRLSDEMLQNYIACEIQSQYLKNFGGEFHETNNNFSWKGKESSDNQHPTISSFGSTYKDALGQDPIQFMPSQNNSEHLLQYPQDLKNWNLLNSEEMQAVNYERYCEVFQRLYHEQFVDSTTQENSKAFVKLDKTSLPITKSNDAFLHPGDVPISLSNQSKNNGNRIKRDIKKHPNFNATRSGKRKFNDKLLDVGISNSITKKQCTKLEQVNVSVEENSPSVDQSLQFNFSSGHLFEQVSY